MKRHGISLLIHPYKNRLLPPAEMKKAVDSTISRIIDLALKRPNIRFNFVLPGYILEVIDPLKLLQLRNIQKRGTLEFLSIGYTEPFLSFSPPWLTCENIRTGIQINNDLLRCKPEGYVPPFSNWEPHYIHHLQELGLHYVILSSALLPTQWRSYCGCWSTEHLGASMVIFPVHSLHHYNAPANFEHWLSNLFLKDDRDTPALKTIGIRYLLPLIQDDELDYFQWLIDAFETFDKLVLRYQTLRFTDYLTNNNPLGLQYLPPGLIFENSDEKLTLSFRNWIYTYDQVGIMHRKMMEICDRVSMKQKNDASLIKELFFAQDINHYLPTSKSGFTSPLDRAWCFEKIIDIEQKIRIDEKSRGAQIRIVDYLRNGGKILIMSNKALKVYIDHRNGGNVFELDFMPRNINLAAVYKTRTHKMPRVIVPGESKAAFCTHFLPVGMSPASFRNDDFSEIADFNVGRFDYTVKKTTNDIKAVLTRQGGIVQGDKNCPLTMEKVFALDNQKAAVSFVCQLTNSTMTAYHFVFAVELVFLLPGAMDNNAQLESGKKAFDNLAWEPAMLSNVNELVITDRQCGLQAQILIPKRADIWCLPVGAPNRQDFQYQGTSVVIAHTVDLEPNSVWTHMSKLSLKKVRKKGKIKDAI